MSAIAGLVVFGFGGHARSVANVALGLGIREFIFVDKTAGDGEALWGFPVRQTFGGPLPEGWQAFAASGENRTRQFQTAAILGQSWPLATLISSTASIGAGAQISAGCFIGHHAHIGPLSSIGTGCIVNTAAVVDHECTVGDYTHVSVNASLGGRCSIGSFVFLGIGSVVIDKVNIGDLIVVGAGGVVVGPLVEPGTYVGVPACPIGGTTN